MTASSGAALDRSTAFFCFSVTDLFLFRNTLLSFQRDLGGFSNMDSKSVRSMLEQCLEDALQIILVLLSAPTQPSRLCLMLSPEITTMVFSLLANPSQEVCPLETSTFSPFYCWEIEREWYLAKVHLRPGGHY